MDRFDWTLIVISAVIVGGFTVAATTGKPDSVEQRAYTKGVDDFVRGERDLAWEDANPTLVSAYHKGYRDGEEAYSLGVRDRQANWPNGGNVHWRLAAAYQAGYEGRRHRRSSQ